MRRFGRVEFYMDRDKEIRWRILGANNRTLCDSGEGYKRRAGATRGVMAAMKIMQKWAEKQEENGGLKKL